MLLDTNAISAWAKGHLPSIALGEYRYGLLKSARRAELERWLDQNGTRLRS